MSVLFKALQKAEKENEQRQTAGGGPQLDAGRLGGSGAIKLAGRRGVNWRLAGLGAAVVLGAGLGASFLLTEAPTVTPVAPGTSERIAVMQPQPAPAAPSAAPAPPVPDQQVVQAPPPAAAPTDPAAQVAPPTQGAQATATQGAEAPAAQVAEAPSTQSAEAIAAAPEAAPAASPAAEKAVAAAPAAPRRPERMPELPANSRARQLNPPIAIQRAEFELAGVGNAVQVREVSRAARDNVSAGYDALVRGTYDMALSHYEAALKEEPNSVLALIGRGAALQKLGKLAEANTSYEQALKIDPNNREALSNLTVTVAERSPEEALKRLLDLEREYPAFSPVKAQIGLTYAKLGAMNEALDYLRRATVMAPEALMYKYNMALVLDHLGLTDQAVAAYETVLVSMANGRGAPELKSTDIERRVRFLKSR